MLIDDFMPAYDRHEVHAIRVRATPEGIFGAIRTVTPGEIQLFSTLMWLRSLPARIAGRAPIPPLLAGEPRSLPARPILELAARSGFLPLGEEADHELVIGSIGRFWRLWGSAPLEIDGPREFLAFDRPDYAKAVLNFLAEEEGGGWTRVTTETRVLATDAGARRKFALYWLVIHPGSAAIRRAWLAAVKRRAEAPSPTG